MLVSKAPDLDDMHPRPAPRSTPPSCSAPRSLTAARRHRAVGLALAAGAAACSTRAVPLRTLTAHYLAGQFVGNVLPSTIGGDVVRVARASTTRSTRRTIAFASVVLERLTGFVALPLLVFVGFALRPSLLDADHAWIALLVAGITLVVLGSILFAAGHPRIAGRFAEQRELDALHRRGAPRRRPRSAASPRQLVAVLGDRARLPALGRR